MLDSILIIIIIIWLFATMDLHKVDKEPKVDKEKEIREYYQNLLDQCYKELLINKDYIIELEKVLGEKQSQTAREYLSDKHKHKELSNKELSNKEKDRILDIPR